jgi:hypothetical protein
VEGLGRGVNKLSMKAKTIITCIAAVAIIAFVIMILPAFRSAQIDSNRSFYVARAEMWDVATALNKFETTYKEFPLGKEAAIFKALYGSNSGNFIFLSRGITNSDGQMLDPWKTPYQIQFFQETNFVIRSAGKNKIIGDADDIIFNSVSNDFVKP